MPRHLLDIRDLSTQELDALMDRADDIIQNPKRYAECMHGKKLATLFYEPSTRTRLSFEAAMLELGGSVLGFSSADSSSASKGESVADTVRTVGCYADIIAMRHPKEGAPTAAAQVSPVPIINAGDGGHNHPTQTLADLLTIRREKGRLNQLVIGCCGDLQFGRTVHSLINAMMRYKSIRFVLISPEELRVPEYVRESMHKNGVTFVEVERLEDVIGTLDILYMTRVQRERFFNEADYVRLKDSYILDADKMRLARKDLCVLHPLPRVNEISRAVDDDPRACYFRQVANGKFMREALLGGGMNIDSIQNGYVIDHIRAGRSMEIYHYLGLDALDCSVAIIKNAKSQRMGKKDIIKIDQEIPLDLDLLGYIDPGISVNIIRDGKLVEKKKPEMPARVVNVMKCKNPRCITQTEQELDQIFVLADREKQVYRCFYCEAAYRSE